MQTAHSHQAAEASSRTPGGDARGRLCRVRHTARRASDRCDDADGARRRATGRRRRALHGDSRQQTHRRHKSNPTAEQDSDCHRRRDSLSRYITCRLRSDTPHVQIAVAPSPSSLPIPRSICTTPPENIQTLVRAQGTGWSQTSGHALASSSGKRSGSITSPLH